MFGGNAEDVAHEPVVQAGLIDHWREEFGLNPPVVIYLVATGIKLTEVQKTAMKLFLVLLFMCGFYTAYTQAFAPFNDSVPKRFVDVNNSSESEYFIFPVSVDFMGDTMVFHQYRSLSGEFIDVQGTSCDLWGGGTAEIADTNWLGRTMRYHPESKLFLLRNQYNEIISFDFNLAIGDSAVFYENSEAKYFIRLESVAVEPVLNTSDMVKSFTVTKYNDLGQVLQSDLNGFEIKLGESTGLISFMDCYRFPEQEIGVTLLGQLNPTLGYYQLTMDEVFPWVPGDMIQVRGTHSISQWGSTISYKLVTVTERIETIDSVWIYLNIQELLVGGFIPPFNISYPNPIVFRKGENLNPHPNGMMGDNGEYFQYDTIDYCGERTRFVSDGQFVTYCPEYDCFPGVDGFYMSFLSRTYLSGLGQTAQGFTNYGPGPESFNAVLIYSNVGGLSCGEFVPLSVGEFMLDVECFPNPVIDYLYVSSPEHLERVDVLSCRGDRIISERFHGSQQYINVSGLAPGFYFAQIIGSRGQFAIRKFTKS